MLSMTIDILWIPLMVILGVASGYVFRNKQVKKSNDRILVLESELSENRIEIAKLHQELAELRLQSASSFNRR